MEKILIIAGALHIGGAERVAANICLFAPQGEFEFHYAVFEGYENVYGPEIEAHGGKILTLPSPKNSYIRYCQRLADLIRTHRYSAVHSHTQFNSGINLLVAKAMHVPIRIAHSHTTKTERRVSYAQKCYEQLMRLMIRGTATHLLACGVEAGNWMFGKQVFAQKGLVLNNGIDTKAFAFSGEKRVQMREKYGIAPDAFVIGHAGTLLPLKNQVYLIRLLPKIQKRRPKTILLLLGADSEGQESILRAEAQSCGVSDFVIFGGGVRNVNEVLSAMDVFAFPSLREGTPLALLEAQANGLPCVVSDCVPNDAFLTDLIVPLKLENPDAWIEALLQAKRSDSACYVDEIARLGYDLSSAFRPLFAIYRELATVSFSFDDGRGDNTAAANKLFLPMQLPLTLNLTTGYIDGSCPAELLPSKKAPMTLQDVQCLANNPLVEIAMHGDQHLNTEEDLFRSGEKLHAWLNLPENIPLGFASPGSGMELAFFRSPKGKQIRNYVAYHRTSLRITSKKLIRIFCRKAARVIHLPNLYRVAYHDTIMKKPDGKILYSVPVMRDITVSQILSLVKDCVRQRGMLVLMFHSIESAELISDNWSWDVKKASQLCGALADLEKRGVLQCRTTGRLYELLQERESSGN